MLHKSPPSCRCVAAALCARESPPRAGGGGEFQPRQPRAERLGPAARGPGPGAAEECAATGKAARRWPWHGFRRTFYWSFIVFQLFFFLNGC